MGSIRREGEDSIGDGLVNKQWRGLVLHLVGVARWWGEGGCVDRIPMVLRG